MHAPCPCAGVGASSPSLSPRGPAGPSAPSHIPHPTPTVCPQGPQPQSLRESKAGACEFIRICVSCPGVNSDAAGLQAERTRSRNPLNCLGIRGGKQEIKGQAWPGRPCDGQAREPRRTPACRLDEECLQPGPLLGRETGLQHSSQALRDPGGTPPVGSREDVLTSTLRKSVSRPACHLVLRTAARGHLQASSALLVGHRLPCLAPISPSLLGELPGSPRPQGRGEGTSLISIRTRLRPELLGS